jgi:hypothetical protein
MRRRVRYLVRVFVVRHTQSLEDFLPGSRKIQILPTEIGFAPRGMILSLGKFPESGFGFTIFSYYLPNLSRSDCVLNEP